jgi:hypothetical protein
VSNTINERQEVVDEIHAEIFGERLARQAQANGAGKSSRPSTDLDDETLLQKARAAKNGTRFAALYDRGDWQSQGYASVSEADLALGSMLAFWCDNDPARIDRLFRSSALMRKKWDRIDYRDRTIARVLTGNETYGSKVRIEEPAAYVPAEQPWPAGLGEAAFYGIAGKFVRLIAPHTEADPAGLMLQLLVATGNLTNRNTYHIVDGATHFTNLYVVQLGESGRGRKGTALARVMQLLKRVDPVWAGNVAEGLSSGEGLIHAVRDPVERTKVTKDGGRQIETVDAGVTDKRLLITETEFESPLSMAARSGNTLSAVVRRFWDGGDARSLVRNSPDRATGAHVSIIGHVTQEGLLSKLERTETANGFANRFLFACVKRAQLLPHGGNLATSDFDALVADLLRIKTWCSTLREINFDAEAYEAWSNAYADLSAPRPGLFGAVTGRAEAQTLRLAILYAALDCSTQIKMSHLRAALAVWEFCERSARYIFGDALGDPDADAILQALRAAPDGITRTGLHDLFHRHFSLTRMDRALVSLQKHRLAVSESLLTTGGRPTELWKATRS